MDDINVDDILEAYASVLGEQTSEEHIRESTSFTIATGTYNLALSKKEWRDAYKPAPDGTVKPKRLRAHLQFTATDPETGLRKGTIFADVSPIIRRFENGNMDGAAKLWGNLAKVHDSTKRSLSARKLFEELGAYAYSGRVKELFRVPGPDGEKLKAAASPEEAKTFREAGYEAMNVLNSIAVVKRAA